jgi:hypothetical protein
VLIRRDNVEHLLMIGGPTDVVVEPNIVRATGGREVAREPAARQIPTADSAWPLQPSNEPTPLPPPSRPARTSATEEPWLAPEPGARPRPADTLPGLATEMSTRLEPAAPATPVTRIEPATRPSAPVVSAPAEPAAAAQTDHNLAEMAQQLEAALRRGPTPESRPPVTDPLAKLAPPRDFKPRIEPKFEANPKAEPAAAAKSNFDNLEEEMASLLGRPPGKT